MRFQRAIAVVALLLSVACHPGPVLGSGAKPPGVGGTIAGTVRASDNTTPLSARKVTAINTETGARFDVATAANGGYTIQVPAGTYRLEVEVRNGEAVRTQPDTTKINVGDLDPDRNFVIAPR